MNKLHSSTNDSNTYVDDQQPMDEELALSDADETQVPLSKGTLLYNFFFKFTFTMKVKCTYKGVY